MKDKLRQFVEAWRQLREVDPRAVALVFTGAMVGLLVGTLIGLLISPWFAPFSGLMLASLGGMLVFNRRLQKAQYTAIEGHVGAAAAVLQIMRGQWFVTPAVSVNTKQDMVHRAIGRCGVVLVGEGSPARVKGLLAKEQRRLSKVVGDVTIHRVLVGDAEGQVSLRRLQMHLSKLPRELKKTEVPKLERKLKPLDRSLPIPKGVDPGLANRPRPKPR